MMFIFLYHVLDNVEHLVVPYGDRVFVVISFWRHIANDARSSHNNTPM